MQNLLIKFDAWLTRLFYDAKKHEKESLREILTQKRRILSAEAVKNASANVVAQITELPAFRGATNILIYYPIQNEIDVRALRTFAPEKRFFLPIVHRKDIELREYTGDKELKRGKFGIPEPQGESYRGKIDLILVPGIAFDKQGNRLGRGGGYYDRFLRKYSSAKKVGVGYNFQLVKEVPTNWRDVRMDSVMVSD